MVTQKSNILIKNIIKTMKKEQLVNPINKQILLWKELIHFFTDKKCIIPKAPILSKKEINEGWQVALFFCLGTTQKDLEKTFHLSWKILQTTRKTWSSDNIFNSTRYKLSFNTPRLIAQNFYWKKIKISKQYQGLSVLESRRLIRSNNVYIAGHEALQLLIINKIFSRKFNGITIPFLHLGGISLSNIKTSHDLDRSICLYTVGQWLVLDRLGIEYRIPWNNCILIK